MAETHVTKVGIVGIGFIGSDHLHRLSKVVANVDVTAVCDIVPGKAQKQLDKLGLKAKDYSDYHDLVNDPDVEVVVCTASNEAHYEIVMAALAAGKFTFCEKPLALDAQQCLDIIDSEKKLGRRMLQVGFMRHYAPEYVQMKKMIDDGVIGNPLMIDERHYNQTQPEEYDTSRSIIETAIHEIDLDHWLINDDYKNIRVFAAKQTRHAQNKDIMDPMIVMMETKTGINISIEVFVRCQYGYDIKCDVIGEEGVLELPTVPQVATRLNAQYSTAILTDWKARFESAYDIEFRDFINHVSKNESPVGPSSWDGYIAAVTADAALKSIDQKGETQNLDFPETPAFYAAK
ncbi:Gfo/Idh/MocA family oxidoreductase [Lactobacillus sp. LC28-10]|uniref:Inositol 2-dehydrogenase/D-chiro-inositol 3-dehydrogenase n=1 Tax=Secundilactobacillus angelensis TaxID=2722706 RepID=A0ABX1KZJ4_9LACO|nr:Gfo/Idh/MocA family oxidoreductase [Secundilactobacillus angelensis]MCH5461755.1 Gfo/Idh/MocA family oxidoreductase [Secundilactobacillus angelensis]NLR18594.1 Gfo/Idh/MocA family oxidoreductase [Secundilactobacillus angelensis]